MSKFQCPGCAGDDTIVLQTRKRPWGLLRRRECVNVRCGRRFSTKEVISDNTVKVLKRSNSYEELEIDKIQHSIQIAFAGQLNDSSVKLLSEKARDQAITNFYRKRSNAISSNTESFEKLPTSTVISTEEIADCIVDTIGTAYKFVESLTDQECLLAYLRYGSIMSFKKSPGDMDDFFERMDAMRSGFNTRE